jgi:hypothetical protein
MDATMELNMQVAANVVLVMDAEDKVVGLEVLVSPEITDGADAVRLLETLRSNLNHLGFCVQTLQRHAIAVRDAAGPGEPEAAPAGGAADTR